jgi:signal transduction histidine kinase
VALCELLGQTSTEVERISRNLRPGVLENLGLAAALEGVCAEFSRRAGVRHRLRCEPVNTRLSPEAELALYRILQEALRNVERHARASQVIVRLSESSGGVQLSIRDNGIGFDPALRSLPRRGMIDLGLLGMRERAHHVGGTFQINTAPRAGTKIVTRIPFAPEPSAAR